MKAITLRGGCGTERTTTDSVDLVGLYDVAGELAIVSLLGLLTWLLLALA